MSFCEGGKFFRFFLEFSRSLLIKARRLSYRLSNSVVWDLQKFSIIKSIRSILRNEFSKIFEDIFTMT